MTTYLLTVPWTTRLGTRLLRYPFPTVAEAQAFADALDDEGVSSTIGRAP